jgi:hypothetical protein
MSKKTPDGFTCECGEFHEFSGYVYAHPNDLLTHTCPRCARKHQVRNFTARLVESKSKGKSKK